jgi:cobalt transporter subunit CbtA
MPLVSPATNQMIQRMVTSAVFAGFAAGLLAALLHFAFVQKLILLGEQYESGAMVHFGGGVVAQDHDHAVTTEAEVAHETADGHDHKHEASGDGASRNALTSLMFGLSYVGYALILVAGFGLAETFGITVTLREGLLWGIAGFAAFQLAPAMGMAPELPGTMAADITARQFWWAGTAICTAAGLALLGYGKGAAAFGAGLLLLATPHLIGAPELETYSGVAPPELASAFATRSLGAALVVWASMGAFAARLWSGK